MYNLTIALLLNVIIAIHVNVTESLKLKVGNVEVIGKDTVSVLSGNVYHTFSGLPYAEAPLNELRFMPPTEKTNWESPYDATHERAPCLQNDSLQTHEFIGSEDCLYLNVDIPAPPDQSAPRAVMVYFHGGGFYTGSGTEALFPADFLMDQGVILVRVNYRLHAFGFLNLGLEECRGNAGLKDQAFAIKWVKKNIHYFGGDGENITIFGQSAGASSVHFQLITPLEKDFQKAIVQSGTSMVPWALSYDYKEMAHELGQRLGFGGGDDQQLLKYLKEVSAEKLNERVEEMMNNLRDIYPARCTIIPFPPSVEEIIDDKTFLPALPETLVHTAKPMPVMIGVNSREGLFIFEVLIKDLIEVIKSDFRVALKYNFEMTPENLSGVSEIIKQYYFKDKEVGLDTVEDLADLYSDMYFYLFNEAIEFLTKSSIPPFVYQFSYDGGLNLLKKKIASDLKTDIKGACHSDELNYLFPPKMSPVPIEIEGDDRTVVENITSYWANFAKYGNPTANGLWKPSTVAQPQYLNIDLVPEMIQGTVYGERLQNLKKTLGPISTPYDIFTKKKK